MTDDDSIEVEAAAPDDEEILSIAELVAKQVRLQTEVEEMQVALTLKVNELRAVQEQALPDAMIHAGVAAWTTVDGKKVTIKEGYIASVPTGEREKDPEVRARLLAVRDAWFTWLRANGHEDIIKIGVAVDFAKGEQSLAAKLVEFIQKTFKDKKVAAKEAVHSGTLRAFVREQIGKGVEFPTELGIVLKRVAVIEGKKALDFED